MEDIVLLLEKHTEKEFELFPYLHGPPFQIHLANIAQEIL
jgi:hypothetical protein